MADLTRRELLKRTAAGAAGAAVLAAGGRAGAEAVPALPSAKTGAGKDRWQLSLNTSTIRPASLEDKIAVAAKAGYDAIELWSNDLDAYEKGGKSLADLGKRVRDAGLAMPNIIGIFGAMPPTDEEKAKAADGFRQKMRQAGAVGAKHIAVTATPDRPDLDVRWAAKQYAELIDMGKEFGVAPAFEFLGPTKGLPTLGQAAAVAMESGRPEAGLVADTFHMYRGGSAWSGIRLTSGSLYAVWHINDVPKEPPQFELKDADRLYPGDGILPLAQALKDLWAVGFRGPLSLEIFNREEWKKDPAEVARIGLEKMRRVIAASGTGA
jgi:sugar phosphate isomerase/epimerase